MSTQPHFSFSALHASHAGIWIGSANGPVQTVGKGEAAGRAAESPLVMLNAPLVAQRLGYGDLSGLDILELFAFIYPARFAVPTPKGMASVLNLTPPDSDKDVPAFLLMAAERLLAALSDPSWAEREGAWDSAQALMRSIIVAMSDSLPLFALIDDDGGGLDRADHLADAATDADGSMGK